MAQRSALGRGFFARPATVVAQELLGCLVSHAGVTVRLTETEAYAGERDPGSHAFRGRTPRTAVMFGPAGFLYVYFTYGNHWCVNLVTGSDGAAEAVLLRGGAVVEGHDLAAARRPGVRERDWCRGPGRLTRTLDLDGRHTGLDVCRPPLGEPADVLVWSPDPAVDPARLRAGPRVGVSGPGGDGEAFPWRFWLADEPTVSAYRPGTVRRRSRT